MSEWDIYWVMQMDSIKNFLKVMTGISFVISFVVFVFSSLAAELNGEDLKAFFAKFWKAFGFIVIPVCVAMLVANALTPSTKTLAAMKILPPIVNNEGIKAEAGDLYKLAKDALRNAAGVKEE